MLIIDGHQDLASNAISYQRDLTQTVADLRAAEAHAPWASHVGTPTVSLPAYRKGGIALVFATLFALPARKNKYPEDDRVSYNTQAEAHEIAQTQLAYYHQLAAERPDLCYLVTNQATLNTGIDDWQAATPPTRKTGLIMLMEGADPIRTPAEVGEWYRQGVRMVGPAWTSTIYAGGTGEPGDLTAAGLNLLREMARLNMILDLSHMTDAGITTALYSYPGPLIASHSNPRALFPQTQSERHFSDEAIKGVARRGGVIGVVLFNKFLREVWQPGKSRSQVSLQDVADHIDYMAQLVGDTTHIGIGSDLDGGFGLEATPSDIDTAADLSKLADVLAGRGYSQDALAGIMGQNWLRFLQKNL